MGPKFWRDRRRPRHAAGEVSPPGQPTACSLRCGRRAGYSAAATAAPTLVTSRSMHAGYICRQQRQPGQLQDGAAGERYTGVVHAAGVQWQGPDSKQLCLEGPAMQHTKVSLSCIPRSAKHLVEIGAAARTRLRHVGVHPPRRLLVVVCGTRRHAASSQISQIVTHSPCTPQQHAPKPTTRSQAGLPVQTQLAANCHPCPVPMHRLASKHQPPVALALTWVEAPHARRRNGVPACAGRQAAHAGCVPWRPAHAATHAPRAEDGVAGANQHAPSAAQRPRLHQPCVEQCGCVERSASQQGVEVWQGAAGRGAAAQQQGQ